MTSSRKQLVLSLKGQQVHIPDLSPIFQDWPQGVNAEVHGIRQDIEQRLESLFPDDPRLEKLKAADFSMFGSCWWPKASVERLRIVIYLSIWLFVWDDELDWENAPLANDFSRGQTFRSETIAYLRHYLSLGKLGSSDEPSNNIITSFKVIGDAICKEYTETQRQLLFEQLIFYIDCSEMEQRVRLSGKLPTVQEYWHFRMGTSAVGVTLAVNEFALGSEISTMMINKSMTALWDYANEVIWLVNDILSIKKELVNISKTTMTLGRIQTDSASEKEQNTVQSLIPLLFNDVGSAQAAIDSAVASLLAAVNGFDKLANDLADQYRSDDRTQAALQDFIDACRLQTKRYGICQETCTEGIRLTFNEEPPNPNAGTLTGLPSRALHQFSNQSGAAALPSSDSDTESGYGSASENPDRRVTDLGRNLRRGSSIMAEAGPDNDPAAATWEAFIAQLTDGQGAYNSQKIAIGTIRTEQYLVLPRDMAIPDVAFGEVGSAAAHSALTHVQWMEIYYLNKGAAPDGVDPVKFALLRLEAVKIGWLTPNSTYEVRRADAPSLDVLLDTIRADLAAMDKHAEIARRAAFILPMVAEHTFRTMGHRYILGDSVTYVARYEATLKACLCTEVARYLPPAALYHAALHWVGPARAYGVVRAQINTARIPHALSIRASAAPAGTALIIKTSAVLEEMASLNLDLHFAKHGGFNFDLIRNTAAEIKANPPRYHPTYFAYGLAAPPADLVARVDAAKAEAIKFVPYPQAFISTYLRGTYMGKERIFTKHAEQNPVQLHRARALFNTMIRKSAAN
ncbi:hypothetical protein DSL72_001125 [Monilinia vaccinii-corymbosi]|uniref:Terpene synthase n=1 Tax=Monilinia vaccinii-corymbosi TaxID=61207 RepID=A0A8A3P920_9HELO|nr:hypothetical protein DSL72_001125 [Monilinia vaccinii-corymbosi]